MTRVLTYLLLLAGFTAGAQTYLGEIQLPAINTDGFYRIPVKPEVAPYFTAGFENLRITDEQELQVPYIVESIGDFSSEEYVEYSVIEKAQVKGCCTNLILENDKKGTINNLHLRIKNAEVVKTGTLMGSDDREQWYALKERFLFNTIDNPSGTSEIRVVDFPLSNYRYYWLKIEDSASAPLNILSAGYYKKFIKDGLYSGIPHLSFTVADSAKEKKSYISITLDTLQWVDRMVVFSRGAPLYSRNATLYDLPAASERRKRATENGFVASFQLKNGAPALVDIGRLRTNELRLVIENHDNPALRIDSIRLYQLTRFLIVYLEAGKRYTMKIGAVGLPAPVYDLQQFRNIIPQTTALEPGLVTIYKKQKPETFTLFTPVFMWLAIAGIIILLGFFTYRMLKDPRVSENPRQ